MDAEQAAEQATTRRRGAGFRVLVAVRDVLTASAIWTLIGVPVAGLLSIIGIVLLVTGRFSHGFFVGMLLGAAQGLWLTFGGRVVDVEDSRSNWPGVVSGAVLGLLAFLSVLSQVHGIVLDYGQLAWLVSAVVCGGMVAGVLSHRVIAAYGPWYPPTRGRSAMVGSVLLLTLGVADARLYWRGFVERLPVPAVSHREVASIGTGSARGSQWSGCYQYTATVEGLNYSSHDSGRLIVQQTNGELRVQDPGDQPEFRGRVDADGSFRVGSEREFSGRNGSGSRVLLEGKFSGDSAIFTERKSMAAWLTTSSWRLSGTARRAACPVQQDCSSTMKEVGR